MKIIIGCFEIELPETVNCLKKYNFIETIVMGKTVYKNGFTEIRKLGKHWFTIRHDMSNVYHVTNIENMEIYVKNFLRLS